MEPIINNLEIRSVPSINLKKYILPALLITSLPIMIARSIRLVGEVYPQLSALSKTGHILWSLSLDYLFVVLCTMILKLIFPKKFSYFSILCVSSIVFSINQYILTLVL